MRIRDVKIGMRVIVCASKEFSKGKIPERYNGYPYWADKMVKTIGKTGKVVSIETLEDTKIINNGENVPFGIIEVKIPKHGSWIYFSCDVNPV